jgi:hypothetical protein
MKLKYKLLRKLIKSQQSTRNKQNNTHRQRQKHFLTNVHKLIIPVSRVNSSSLNEKQCQKQSFQSKLKTRKYFREKQR